MLKKWICTITAMVLIWTLAVCFVHAADAAASLTVTPGYTLLDVGETVQLFPTVLPVSADRRLVYQSNDTSVATVEQNGLVTAVGKGEAEIKVISEIGGILIPAAWLWEKKACRIPFCFLHGTWRLTPAFLQPTDTIATRHFPAETILMLLHTFPDGTARFQNRKTPILTTIV